MDIKNNLFFLLYFGILFAVVLMLKQVFCISDEESLIVYLISCLGIILYMCIKKN